MLKDSCFTTTDKTVKAHSYYWSNLAEELMQFGKEQYDIFTSLILIFLTDLS